MTVPRAPLARRPRPEPKARPSRSRRIVAGLVLAVCLATFLFLCLTLATSLNRGSGRDNPVGNRLVDWLDAPVSNSNEAEPFTVRSGDDAGTIGQRLEEAGLVRSGLGFRLLATYYGATANLKAGDYSLRPNLRTSEIIDVLQGGGTASRVLTIPEGWQLGQIRRSLIERAGFSQAEVEAALGLDYAEFEFLQGRPPGSSLEGYLFPATYPIGSPVTAADLIRQMLQVFDRRVTPDLRQRTQAQGLSLHEAVTRASVVEREAVHHDERALIAGVFLNRLRQGMRLQADPTVQYALAKLPGPLGSSGTWKAPLSREDLRVDSPYNTYRYPGLPPGPIASPSRLSLEAVANPAQTDFLYFVATADGRHVFSTTFAEHQRNVAEHQR